MHKLHGFKSKWTTSFLGQLCVVSMLVHAHHWAHTWLKVDWELTSRLRQICLSIWEGPLSEKDNNETLKKQNIIRKISKVDGLQKSTDRVVHVLWISKIFFAWRKTLYDCTAVKLVLQDVGVHGSRQWSREDLMATTSKTIPQDANPW